MEEYESEIVNETAIVQATTNLPALQSQNNSVAPTREGSQINAVMTIGSQLALCNPRNEGAVLRKVLGAADESWLYSIPFAGDNGKQNVTGLSVKCARTAVRHYRNVAVFPAVREIVAPNDNGEYVPAWEMTVAVVDLENNVIETTNVVTHKPQRKNGEKDMAYTQRLYRQQLAFLGRVERNAIMKILPGEWVAQIRATIKAKSQLKPLSERVKETVAGCEALGVTKRDLERITGCKADTWSEVQWADIRGRLTAVREGEGDRDEVFELRGDSQPRPQTSPELQSPPRRKPGRRAGSTSAKPAEPPPYSDPPNGWPEEQAEKNARAAEDARIAESASPKPKTRRIEVLGNILPAEWKDTFAAVGLTTANGNVWTGPETEDAAFVAEDAAKASAKAAANGGEEWFIETIAR